MKNFFCYIRRKVYQWCSAVLISRHHALSLLQKTVHQRSILSVYEPRRETVFSKGKKCHTEYSVEYETVYVTEHKRECTTKYNTKATTTTTTNVYVTILSQTVSCRLCTDKKENSIFLMCKEIQTGAVGLQRYI
jgi:hypothetical protein